jgi:hypothetical protein
MRHFTTTIQLQGTAELSVGMFAFSAGNASDAEKSNFDARSPRDP